MLSALSQPSLAGNGQPSRSQSPSKKMSSAVKSEPEHDNMPPHPLDGQDHGQAQYRGSPQHLPSSTHTIGSQGDDQMDYADETPVHPLAPVPQQQQQQHSSASSGSIRGSPTTPQAQQHSPYMISSSIQPQQHQQLLKLKTEHGFPNNAAPSSPSMSTPDIVMTNDDSDEVPSSMGPSRRSSSETNMGANEAMIGADEHPQNPHLAHHHDKGHHLVVDTTLQGGAQKNNIGRALTPNTATTFSSSSLTVDTPTTGGPTAPSSRRPSLRTMTATLPRSALQEETIALFKQYRNLIPCAKCFCRNTIQRDGMSDGNLRFKCRPPVSMSLICNKSYSESKIRNMIAGVVYGHSLPDSNNTPTSATSPGDNVLALAPPPVVKASGSRRGSKIDNSPRIGSELTPERLHQRLQLQQQQQQQQEELERDQLQDERDSSEGLSHPMDARRASQSIHSQQGSSSRRGSVQQLVRRPSMASMAGEDSMMMDYDEQAAQQLPPSNHSGHLQVPGTPPMDGSDDPRFYRPKNTYGRSVTPTGPVQPPPQQGASSGRQIHKLHHSHSHPNIGQVRHQQYLEQQQELQREHRGSISGMGYQAQQSQSQQQQQRAAPRQIIRRDSSQYLGGSERRSSQPSPVMNVGGSKYMGEALSPALSSSPRSSPSREAFYNQSQHQQGSLPPQDPAAHPRGAHAGSSRYDESTNNAGYFQRRMSQPHPSHAYNSNNGHSGLPPPLPSPLSHPYDRRASEAEEYPQMHREKYERLNANTMLAPSSALASSRQQAQQQPKMRSHYPPGSPNAGMHPLDSADQIDDASSSRQALTPPMRSAQHLGGPAQPSASGASAVSSPWANGNGQGGPQNLATPQSEPMRYSQSLPMSTNRPPLRHHYSSSSLYYQTPRPEDRDRFENENERDLSPDYQEVDAEGRPIARMRPQGLKRKSLGQSLSRSNSNQNLYQTSLQQYQNQYQHHQQHPRGNHHSDHHYHYNQQRDLNAAMPRSAIKLTCFPGSNSKTAMNPLPTTKTLDTSEAMAMQLSQSSKIVIEIRQPRALQSYSSATSLREQYNKTNGGVSGDNHKAGGDSSSSSSSSIQRSSSHPNMLLARSSSSVLGYRRSPSPDRMDFGGAPKKRRADSDSIPSGGSSAHEDQPLSNSSSSVAETAAAAVVAAAAAAAAAQASHIQQGSNISSSAIQVFGMDYLAKNEVNDHGSTAKEGGVGLGLSTTSATSCTTPMYALTSSPTVEALRVAKGSSYVTLEDQKEMGIDYSLFTRVETAGWRILIPPNVVASFRSEDFGLMLKPKGVEDMEGYEERDVKEEEGDDAKKSEIERDVDQDHLGGQEDDEDVNVEGVSRIVLRDDDKDELEAEDEVEVETRTTSVEGEQKSGQDNDQEMREDENETVTVSAEAAEVQATVETTAEEAEEVQVQVEEQEQDNADVEMDRDQELEQEQDELVDDE